jgi:hypothetical protein
MKEREKEEKKEKQSSRGQDCWVLAHAESWVPALEAAALGGPVGPAQGVQMGSFFTLSH